MNIGAKREKMCEFTGLLEFSKSTVIRINPSKHTAIGEKTNWMKGWSLVMVVISDMKKIF